MASKFRSAMTLANSAAGIFSIETLIPKELSQVSLIPCTPSINSFSEGTEIAKEPLNFFLVGDGVLTSFCAQVQEKGPKPRDPPENCGALAAAAKRKLLFLVKLVVDSKLKNRAKCYE